MSQINDPVSHPSHYTDGIEVMDYIESKGWAEGFCRGNAVKYISRAGKKNPDKEVEDLKKAAWYLNREIERLSKPTPSMFKITDDPISIAIKEVSV